MRMGLGGRNIGDPGDLVDKVALEEAEGNNIRICSRDTNKLNLYRLRANGFFQ